MGIWSIPARALDFSEESEYSATQFEQSIDGSGDLGGNEDEDTPFSWNVGYSYQRTVTPNAGESSIIDNTSIYSGGVSWSGDSRFGLDAKISYSGTPAENLASKGGQITGSYRWLYAQPKPSGFSPFLYFRLLMSDGDYAESYSGEIPRRKNSPKHVTGTSELRQDMLGVNVKWKPLKSWKFSIEMDQYFYNRNVADFESRLDSPTSLQRGMGNFTNTVGGLAHSTYSFGFSWNFVHEWELAASEQYSRLAADESVSTTLRLTISDQISKRWSATVGVIREESVVFSDTLAVFGVECDL